MKIKIIPVLSILVAAFVFAAAFSGCTVSADDNSGSGDDSTVAVAGVSISGSSSVTAGSSITLTAIVSPDNATDKTVTWSVYSGNSYASVSTSGVVTGKTAGTAVIKASAGGKSATKTITVTASSVGTVTLSGSNGSIVISDMSGTSFTVSYTPSSTVTSCNAYISEGNGTGLAAAAKEMTEVNGVYSYTATSATFTSGAKIYILLYTNTGDAVPQGTLSDSTCSDWASFTYGGDSSGSTVAVTDISISGDDSVTAGSSITLTAIVSPDNATDKTVTWSSSNSGCASVDAAAGIVNGITAGSTVITASAGGKSATKTITVTASSGGTENNTVTDGATDGTSVTGSASSYTAGDITWDTLVWSDEFEGTSLKTANWTYDTGAGGWGNSELETYTTGNAAVHGGVLDITADSSLKSARIKSAGLKTFKYGKIAARIKCSQGAGSWPAFWMLGTSSGSWPYQGEIDIMEHANSDTFTYQTCHWNGNGSDTGTAYAHASWGQTTNTNYWNDITSMNVDEWHIYAIEWTSALIKFYVDDAEVMEMAIGDSTGGTDAFNYPFYIIFNFAMGGQFPNVYSSGSFTNLPWHMYVDYVRVYQ